MSTDVATLVLAVDASAVKQGGAELDKLTEKGKGAEAQTKKLNTATDALRQAYVDIAKAFAAWQISAFVKDSAMMAARFETMGIVMKIAGNNAGYTREQTEKYSKALQEQGISMMQSRDAIVQLATANIDLAKASDLGRAAQDLAVVAGINSSEAMERMIQGIKSGEQEILKTMGMQVSWEASYKKLAAQIGTTSDKLTEQQKVMARTDAVIEEGVKYQGIYEEAMGTAGKAMTSLTRYWDNFKIKAGEVFLPALADAVNTLTDALKAANAELDKAGSSGIISNIGEGLSKAFRVVSETVLVLGANVAYVFAGIGREIGGIAAQATALVTGGGFGAALAIREAMLADNSAAAKALAAYETSVMNPKPAAPKTSSMSEEDRIRQGAAARAKAAAEALALQNKTNRRGGASSVDKEATAYSNLAKSIREKTSAAILEGDGQVKLTDGQKTAAKFAEDIAMGELKLTAVHKAAIVTLLEKQIAVEKQNEQAKVYADSLKSIRETVVTADDATRELSDAQKVLLDLMRAPEWEGMSDVWKQTAIQATAAATAELKVLEIRKEMDDLIANTDTARLEKQREQMQRIAAAYMDNKFGLKGSAEAMKQYSEVVDVALGRNATSLEKEAAALDEFTKSAAQNMQKAMADFLFDPFEAGTKKMLQSFGTMVQKLISQAVAADLTNRLFGDMGKTGNIGGWIGKLLDGKLFSAGSASPGFVGSDVPIGVIPSGSFAVGTDYVPRDMIAKVHKGEKIVPAAENKQGNRGGNVYNATVNLPAGTPAETRRAAGIGMREALAVFNTARRYV